MSDLERVGATLVRLELPDRPGGLALVAGRFAEHGVDIVRVEVVGFHDGVAVDDLLVVGGDLRAALDHLAGDARVLAVREQADLPDPGVAMAEACAQVAAAASLGAARRRLLTAALQLVVADGGVVLRDAGHGWLRPVATTADSLPPIRSGDRSLARVALARNAPLTVASDEDWAPPIYRGALRGDAVALVPGGTPTFLVLAVVRAGQFPFVDAEIERLTALVRVGVGTMLALGERPVVEPVEPAVRVRTGGMR